MNVKKNPIYYAGVGVFVLLAVYSLLVCINAFDFKNIDMNAGLCAVIAAMVVSLIMYLLHATRWASVLYSSPLAKTTLEIVSVLILLTAACVARIYFVGEFEIYIVREAVILGTMFMAYLVARMLNQFGFLTLVVLVPWPYVLDSYELAMSDLIALAEIMAVMLVITFVLYMVRHQTKLKNALMVVFVLAVVGVLAFIMNKTGLQIIEAGDVKQYLYMYEDMFVFGDFERFYYIAAVMTAISGAIRIWMGRGSGNCLVAFAASAAILFMICCGVGNEYFYALYPLLAMVAAGACGTRPAYMDMEIALVDNSDTNSVVRKRRDDVQVADESELDQILDELEAEKPYGSGGGAFNPIKFAAQQEREDEELPIELQMYDFGASSEAEAPKTIEAPKAEAPKAVEDVKKAEAPKAVEEVVEDIVEEAEFEEFVPQPVDAISDDEVIEMIVDDVQISEVEISAVPVVEEAVEETVEAVVEEVAEEAVEMTGSLTESEDVAMPTFEMDASSFDTFEETAEEVAVEAETVVAEVEEVVEEATEEIASVVVEDETAVSIAQSEEFEMPTFEMDTVVTDNVAEMFVQEAEETAEVVEEATEEVVEEVVDITTQLVVEADDVASISEEFEMPTFEMNETVEPESVLEEIIATEDKEEVAVEPEEAVVEAEVEPEPVVLVQNPIFIKNPINFNRTRAYDEPTTDNKDYGFVQSAPTFETMGSFLADNKDNVFPEFETSVGDMDNFLSEFAEEVEPEVTETTEEVQEVVEDKVEEVFESFESVSFDAAAEDDYEEVITVSDEAASIFEYATEESKLVDDIEMPDFMAPELESGDLFGTFKLEDDEDDFEEETSEEIVTEPESVELGLDLGEEFTFGQAQSLTDLYDYDSTPQTFSFEEAVVEVVEEATEDVKEDVETVVETAEEALEEAVVAVTEDVVESVADTDVFVYDEEEEAVEAVETVAPAKDDDVYDWNAAEVSYDDEVVEETVEVAPKSNDVDFFDWNSVDTYNYDDEDEVEEENDNEVQTASLAENSFEEFVWTDEMISELAKEESEEVSEAVQEVAASMEVYDYSEEKTEDVAEEKAVEEPAYTMPEDDEPAQYEVFQSSGNFVPEVEEAVDETQYEVFQSSGNFVPEVEETADETQYEVFESSGNFVPETDEVTDETQYEVFESSGNFEVEPEVVEEVSMYKTYGEEDEDDEEEKKVSSNKEKDEFSLDFPEFDLDLPDF